MLSNLKSNSIGRHRHTGYYCKIFLLFAKTVLLGKIAESIVIKKFPQ